MLIAITDHHPNNGFKRTGSAGTTDKVPGLRNHGRSPPASAPPARLPPPRAPRLSAGHRFWCPATNSPSNSLRRGWRPKPASALACFRQTSRSARVCIVWKRCCRDDPSITLLVNNGPEPPRWVRWLQRRPSTRLSIAKIHSTSSPRRVCLGPCCRKRHCSKPRLSHQYRIGKLAADMVPAGQLPFTAAPCLTLLHFTRKALAVELGRLHHAAYGVARRNRHGIVEWIWWS